jgi:hypothetical protein
MTAIVILIEPLLPWGMFYISQPNPFIGSVVALFSTHFLNYGRRLCIAVVASTTNGAATESSASRSSAQPWRPPE